MYLKDKETSRTSTAPFSSDDLYRFLQIVNDLRVNERGASSLCPRQKAILAHVEMVK